jgi:PEGA domain
MKRRLLVLIALLLVGCVQRQMTVITDPPGAVVSLNDREMGRTPFTKNFLWYGNYDVTIRKDGYQTLKTTAEITAPFWQFVPFDLVTDFLPLTDKETIRFSLKPEVPSDPTLLVVRGEQLRQDLEASQHTVHRDVLEVHPATRTTTKPDVKKSD